MPAVELLVTGDSRQFFNRRAPQWRLSAVSFWVRLAHSAIGRPEDESLDSSCD
jgi:hypothetical protein